MSLAGAADFADQTAADAPSEERRARRLRGLAAHTFESLAVRDFRVLWWGFNGTWMAMQMQQVARGYLAYRMTGTALAVGLVTLAMGLPRIVLSPFGGVIADRFPKRSVLMWTQSAMGLLSLAAALLVAFNLMTLQYLIVLGLLQGAAFAFNMPARQAYIPQIVGKGDMLANAIALNNAGMNLCRVVGPAIAGLVIAVPSLNVAGAFFLVAACYVWVWWSIHRVHNPGHSAMSRRSMGRSLGDGFRYVAHRPALIALMSLGFIPLAVGMPYINLMPVVALGNLNVGSTGLGLLLSVGGIGSLCGTLTIASLARHPGKAPLQLLLGIVFGVAVLGFGFFVWHGQILPALPLLFIAGMCGDAYMALNSTLLMASTDEAVYGRVMGVYMVAQSIRPISVLPVTSLADLIGAPLTLLGCGGFVAAFVGAVARFYPGYRDIGRSKPVGLETDLGPA